MICPLPRANEMSAFRVGVIDDAAKRLLYAQLWPAESTLAV